MNRNQLKYFVAAAESRSFTKAAEQFYISQTAITQQIRLLEETLGCPLFDRSTRPVSLTSAGTIFLREAKGILERMSRAQERVHDASTGLSGTLRVGYVRGYERSDLSAHIRQFHQQNSNVLITFYHCSTDALAAGLLHHEYDIIFTWDSTNLKTQEGVSCRTVEKARLVVALYAGHPLAQRQQLRRQELRGETILYIVPSTTADRRYLPVRTYRFFTIDDVTLTNGRVRVPYEPNPTYLLPFRPADRRTRTLPPTTRRFGSRPDRERERVLTLPYPFPSPTVPYGTVTVTVTVTEPTGTTYLRSVYSLPLLPGVPGGREGR